MDTQEKISLAANTRQLSLHKEGIFYKLYNQHAMLFTENIKPLKIQVKFIKIVKQLVYSCGFPASVLEDVKKRLMEHGGVLDESDKLLMIAAINWPQEPDYMRWCRLQEQEAITAEKGHVAGLTDIEKQIIGFQVMNKTPLEAMHFIIGLQQELQQRQ